MKWNFTKENLKVFINPIKKGGKRLYMFMYVNINHVSYVINYDLVK